MSGMPYYVQIVRCTPVGPNCDTALPAEWLPDTYPTLKLADAMAALALEKLGLSGGAGFYKVTNAAGEAA
jgi:hypothetical protein